MVMQQNNYILLFEGDFSLVFPKSNATYTTKKTKECKIMSSSSRREFCGEET